MGFLKSTNLGVLNGFNVLGYLVCLHVGGIIKQIQIWKFIMV